VKKNNRKIQSRCPAKSAPLERFIAEFSTRISPAGAARLKAEHRALLQVAEAAKDLREQRDWLYAFLSGIVVAHEAAPSMKTFAERVDDMAMNARNTLNTCRVRGDCAAAFAALAKAQKAA
jgi:hypothetical protein